MKQLFRNLLFAILAVASLGMLQFVICTIIAMIRFPEGFSLSENFLSELGIQGYPGHTLFNTSAILLGLSLIPAFAFLWMTDPRNSHAMKFASIMGIISSLGVIGVGSWTYDRFFILHHIAVALWLLPMIYMVIAFYYAASKSPYIGVGYLAVSFFMVVGMIFILLSTDGSSLQMLQKTVVICGLVWLGFVMAFIAQTGMAIYQNWVEDDGARARKEQSYLSSLTSGHHRR